MWGMAIRCTGKSAVIRKVALWCICMAAQAEAVRPPPDVCSTRIGTELF